MFQWKDKYMTFGEKRENLKDKPNSSEPKEALLSDPMKPMPAWFSI